MIMLLFVSCRQLSVDDSSKGCHSNATLSQKIKQLRAQLIAMQPVVGHCRIEVCRCDDVMYLLLTGYLCTGIQGRNL